MTNVSVLIEGRNFYAGCIRWTRQFNVDMLALRDLIQQQTGGKIVNLVYYLGTDSAGVLTDASNDRIESFVDTLQGAGYTVCSFPLKTKQQSCHACGAQRTEIVEKQVDSAISVAAMQMLDQTDLYVLVTNDTDQLPLLRALRSENKRVWICTWQQSLVSNAMLGYVERVLALEEYREQLIPSIETMRTELESAQRHFSGGYVGVLYFIRNWKSDKLPMAPADRSALLDILVKNGLAVYYTAQDGFAAVRLL